MWPAFICLILILLFAFQIALTTVTGILVPPVARLQMQIPTEKHVELFCDLPLEGLLIPLAYNLTLIILCAVYGFLTRKLPENFNESWYIFISVSTTTFLWIVFIPTYFTTFHAYHQAALLAFCLILNASITLLCLYIPKIYAIYFIDEDQLKFVNVTNALPGTSTNMSSVNSTSGRISLSNQVVPISS